MHMTILYSSYAPTLPVTIETHEDFGEDRHFYVDGFIGRPNYTWQVHPEQCFRMRYVIHYQDLHRNSENRPQFTLSDALGRTVLQITLGPGLDEQQTTIALTSDLNSVNVSC